MKQTVKTRLFVWLNNLPSPLNLSITTLDGMDDLGWVKIKTIEHEFDIDMDALDINQAQRNTLELKKQAILEKFNIEIDAIDDHLAMLGHKEN